jgi:glyoxylase-like metal-dependent hydrolase (beta-lactamase superfamily II)
MKIPIPNNPLGNINAYLINTPDGSLLIDSGWNTEEAFESLKTQIESTGVTLADIKYIAITHIHPDHYGLVGRLEKYNQAKLIIHKIERSFLNARYLNTEELLNEMEHWLRINGVPANDHAAFTQESLAFLGLVDTALPVQEVQGGEHILLDDFDLKIVWTPGHSPGHICFYEQNRKILFAGDFILEKITPNISMSNQTSSNPLINYINSLNQVKSFDIDHILPGHGKSFTGFSERANQLIAHHEQRLEEMLALFQNEQKTAYQISLATKWFLPWERLPAFSKRMAVTETLAHLELLFARGSLQKRDQSGCIWYYPSNQKTGN